MQSSERRKNRKSIRLAFTLIELISVVIIVGILASLAIPQYTRAREKTVDKQAQAILSLIRAAERAFYMQRGYYYPTSGAITDMDTINSNLTLDLSNDGNWNYCITSTGGFNASVSRDRGGYNRRWSISSTTVNATCESLGGLGCP